MDRMNDNEALRNDFDLSTEVITSLNQQVNDLLDWNWDIEVQQIKRPRTDWGEAEFGEFVIMKDDHSKSPNNPFTKDTKIYRASPEAPEYPLTILSYAR